jgi:hypothetical protein
MQNLNSNQDHSNTGSKGGDNSGTALGSAGDGAHGGVISSVSGTPGNLQQLLQQNGVQGNGNQSRPNRIFGLAQQNWLD